MSVPNANKKVAFFDVDGTLLKSTIVHCYIWMRSLQMPLFLKQLWLLGLLPKIVYYLILDNISRTRFNEVFYRNYRGLEVAEMKALATEMFEAYMRPKIFAEAMSQMQEHKAQGTTVVLVTGSLDLLCSRLRTILLLMLC